MEMDLLIIVVIELFIIAVFTLIVARIYKAVSEMSKLKYKIARMDQDLTYCLLQIENLTNRKS